MSLHIIVLIMAIQKKAYINCTKELELRYNHDNLFSGLEELD